MVQVYFVAINSELSVLGRWGWGKNIKWNLVYFFSSNAYLYVKLKWVYLVFSSRTRILPCGFRALALEQCLQFLPATIIICRDRINNNQVDFGKGSNSSNSLHSILDPLGTLISTNLRLAFLWNSSHKILGKHPWVVRKANHPSSPNKYGKTATNLNHLPVFQGIYVSLKVANQRHLRSSKNHCLVSRDLEPIATRLYST